MRFRGSTGVPAHKCSGCLRTVHCTAACQKEDWPFLKLECKAMVAAEAAHTEVEEVDSANTSPFIAMWEEHLFLTSTSN